MLDVVANMQHFTNVQLFPYFLGFKFLSQGGLGESPSRRRHICSALYSVTTDFKCFPRPPKGLVRMRVRERASLSEIKGGKDAKEERDLGLERRREG